MDGREKALPFARRRRGERGQTLLFTLVAMVVLVVAIFILFDLHTAIRFKVKSQTAVDAAALTAAKWQKDSLNLIGEINLVKACTTLISDEVFGIGYKDVANYMNKSGYDTVLGDIPSSTGYGRLDRLAAAYGMLTQMQARISFVGPMIGIGAAQQAAKNNGLDYSYNYSKGAVWAYKNVRDTYDADHGLNTTYPAFTWGYSWKAPYLAMLSDLVWGNSLGNDLVQSYAFAVNPNKKMARPVVYFDPDTPYIPADPFNSTSFYTSCFSVSEKYANTGWCFLMPFQSTTFDDLWWKRMKVKVSWSFPYEAEYCPLQVEFASGPAFNSDVSAYVDASGRDLTPLSKIFNNADPYPTTGTYRLDADGNPIRLEYDSSITASHVADTDGKFSPFGSLPRFAWCAYDMQNDVIATSSDGSPSTVWNRWDPCVDKAYVYHPADDALRGAADQKVKYEYAYKSGAFAFMGATFPDAGQQMWIGNMTVKQNSGLGSDNAILDPDSDAYKSSILNYDRYKGDLAAPVIKSHLQKIDYIEKSYLQFAGKRAGSDLFLRTSDKYVATSVAKPMGRIPVKGAGSSSEYISPCSTKMILPVFDNVCLVPKFFPDFAFSSQSPPKTDFFNDPDFYNFLMYCIPEIQDESITNVGTLAARMPGIMASKHPDIWNTNVRRYFEALVIFIGMTEVWEETYGPWLRANRRSCESWRGSGPGEQYGPAVP